MILKIKKEVGFIYLQKNLKIRKKSKKTQSC